jgi:hypothetical protein
MADKKDFNRLLRVKTVREETALRTLVQSRRNQEMCREETRQKENELGSFNAMASREEDELFSRLSGESRSARSIDLERRGMRAIHEYRQVFTGALKQSQEQEQNADKEAGRCSTEYTVRSNDREKAERITNRLNRKQRMENERTEESGADDEFIMLYACNRRPF